MHTHIHTHTHAHAHAHTQDDDIPMTDNDEDDSESDEDADDVEPPKVLGDLLESLAGAIFIDSGMDLQAVWSAFEPLFTAKIGTYTIQ